jgi:hypothetical protein
MSKPVTTTGEPRPFVALCCEVGVVGFATAKDNNEWLREDRMGQLHDREILAFHSLEVVLHQIFCEDTPKHNSILLSQQRKKLGEFE